MLKLLIVDDEKRTREGLKNCISWEEYGITISGEARNGIEAMALCEHIKPDIVLTDVKMPLMDGLELSRQLREKHEDISIVFISGYSDLDYIKSAFKVDGADYILKPVDIAELENVVRKVTEICLKEKNKNSYRLMIEQKLLQSMPFLREKFMKLLVNGDLKSQHQIRQRLEFLEIYLPLEENYTILCLSVDEHELKFGENTQFDRQLLSFSISNIVQESLESYTKGFVFEDAEDRFICIAKLPSEEEDMEEMIVTVSELIHKNVGQFLNLSITLGIGLWVRGLENISASYKHAMNAVGQKFLLGKNQIIYLDKLVLGDEETLSLNGKFYDDLQYAMHAGDFKKASAHIYQWFESLNSLKAVNKKHIQSVCIRILSTISGVASEIEGAGNGVEELDQIQEILKKETLDEMNTYLISACNQVCEWVVSKQISKYGSVVNDIKRIIQTRYSEDISINSLSKEVFLTPAYICLLFKQETGETINDYLTSIRIAKAKEIIRLGKYKLYEISSMLGYSDHKYFSKLFKKHTGLNPSEFK